MRRLAAFDIDGTLTAELKSLPMAVVAKLRDLQQQGWEVALVTGRTLSFASTLLEPLDFPYYLALQNGADLLKMPSKERLCRKYLSSALIPLLDKAYQGMPEDFIIYAGYERGDFCYFRPQRFSASLLTYLNELEGLSTAPWEALLDFKFDSTEAFPLIKCMGSEPQMFDLLPGLSEVPGITSSVIRDPVAPPLFLNLITAKEANKGDALRFLIRHTQADYVVAAGDDRNDLPMLLQADERIVMENAPAEVRHAATLIAKPAKQQGILQAIEEAVHRARR